MSLQTVDRIKTAYTGKESKTNIFGTASNNKLLGTITDDDGIASVTIAYDKDSGGTYSNTLYTNSSVGGSTTFSIPDASFSKLSEGLYYIKVSVKDTLQETTFADYTSAYFAVAVDNGAPQFSSFTPANGGYYSSSKKLAVKGTVSDASGQITLQKTGSAGTSANYTAGKTVTGTTMTAEDTVTPPSTDGSYTLVYTAADRYGQSSTYEITYLVDTTAPSYLPADGSAHTTKSTAQAVQLSVSDQCTAGGTPYGSLLTSGIASVTYAIDDTKGTGNSGTLNYAEQVSGNATENINKYFGIYKGTLLLTDGVKNTVTFTITDNAGNKTTVEQKPTYTVDAEAPVITVGSYNAAYASSGAITLTVTATDNMSLASVTITGTNTAGTVTEGTHYTVTKTDTGTVFIRTITIPADSTLHDGSWTFTVNAQDNAGWPAEQKTISIQVDSKAPYVSSAAAVSNVTINSGTYYIKKASGCTIKGTMTDAVSGIDKMYAAVVSASASVPTFSSTTWTPVDINPKTGAWSYTLDTSSAKDLDGNALADNASYTVYTVAQDALGNTTTAGLTGTAVTFFADAGAPEFTFSTAGGTHTETGSAATGFTYNATYYRSAAEIINGIVTDSAFGSVSYKLTKDPNNDAGNVDHALPAASGGTWSVTPAAAATGTYEYTFTADDKAGYTSKAVITVIVDKSAPKLTITNAAVSTASRLQSNTTITEANAYYSSDGTSSYYTVSGTWTDDQGGTAGTGTDKLYYTTLSNASGITGDAATGWKDCGATASASGTTNWTIAIPVTEGTGKYLAFYAVDKAGNKTDAQAFSNLNYDFEAPAASFSAIGTTTYKRTGSEQIVTVTGTVTDSFKIGTDVTPKAKRDGTEVASGTAGLSITTAHTDKVNTVTYTITIPAAGGTNDGSWTFSLAGKDASGRDSNTSSTSAAPIVIDTAAPALTVTNAASLNASKLITEENSSYKKTGTDTYYVISGTWSDALTGTDKLEYSTDGTNWTSVDNVSKTTVETSWSVQIPVVEGFDKQIQIRASDAAGNVSTPAEGTTKFTDLKFDFGVPEIKLGTYVTQTNKDFTLTGTLEDTLALDTGAAPYGITVTAVKDGSSAATGAVLYTINNGKSVSFSIPVAASTNNGRWIFTMNATDKAGRSAKTVTTNTVLIDTTAPELTTDAEHPFKIGGKVYNTDNWYNDTSLSVEGYLTETGSGIKTIYYWINPDGSAIIAGDTAKISGSFSANTSAGTYCKFSSSVQGFTSNSDTNSIYLAFEDEAGNISAASGSLYTVKIDSTAPVITITSVKKGSADLSTTDTVLSNAKEAITVAGTVEDSASHANTGSGAYSAAKGTFTYGTSGSSTPFTLTLSAADLAALGSGVTVINVTVKDNAGNSSTGSVCTLQIDTTPPDIAITSIKPVTSVSGTATVNKSFTVVGTASDNLALAAGTPVTLFISTDGGSAYSSSTAVTVSGGAWTATVNTAADYTAAKNLVLRASAADKAGNTANAVGGTDIPGAIRTLAVDQNTDRPLIKMQDLTADGITIRYKDNAAVSGILTDDDASDSAKAASFVVSGTPIAVDASGAMTDSASGTTSFDASTGEWTYTPADTSDGTHNLYFYVKDNAGTVFYTANTTSATYGGTNSADYYKPYIQYKNAADAVTNSSVITYKSDSKSPVISSVGGSYGPTDAVGTDITSLTTNNTLGGPNSKFIRFKITASDANGIAGMALKVSEAGKTGTYLYNKATSGTLGTETGLAADSDGTFTANNTSGPNTWTTGAIQLTGTGLITVSVTVYDQSGLPANSTSMFYADNDPPKVEINAPGTETTDWVTSTTTITGTVSDEGTAKVSSIKWMIPTNDQQTAYTESGTVPSTDCWTTLASTSVISIPFDSTVKDNPANILTYANSTYATETGTDTNVWHVPYYIRATDNAGNSRIDSLHYVVVDVDGGRPKAKILYPETNGTVGGTFTVYGTATDDLSVSYVKVQVDTNGDGQFNASDYAALTTASGGKNVWGLSAGSIVAGDGISTWYIKASGTNSWKLELNSASITTDSASIGIRVASVDGSDNTRPYLTAAGDSYVTVKIDQNIPKVSDLKVVQYSAVGSVTSKERSYTTGMYVSNNIGTKQWYLSGTATDDGQIASITLTKANGSDFDITGTVTSAVVSTTPAKKTFYAALPSATDKSGMIYALLSVKDEQGHEFQQYITVNLDNTAPSLYQTDSTEVTTTTSALRLKHASADIDNSTNVVKNDNYLFTFGDTVKDANSGLSFLAFYFERAGSNKVLCPMYDNYTDTASYITIDTAVTSGTASSGKTYINDDGLACIYASGSRGSTTTFTDTANIKGRNIRKGGLIKIGGIYTKITNVDTSSGTVTFADDVSTSFTTAEIIFAQVVDHTGKESIDGTTPYIVDSTTDDGDSMIETLTPSGSSYDWSASIQSDYLTDGPVQIHAVAMDKAGNTSNGYVTTSVQNHCPRIAKVLLGTDLNGNGKFDYKAVSGGTSSQQPVTSLTAADRTAEGTAFGEFSYYSAIASSGSYKSVQDAAQQIVTLGSGSFKVKNRLAILPEFVGGNTGLAYTFTAGTTVGSTAGAVKTTQTDGKSWTGTSAVKLNPMTEQTALAAQCTDTGTGKIADQIHAYGGISISTSDLASYESQTSSSSGARYFAFTFWDKTEGTTQGTDSQYALLVLPVIVDVTDDTPPTADIKPFYWKDAGDNSLYGNSSANGHIELEGDLPTATFKAANSTGLYDIDPKVSGKIRITGTSYDETRLRTISVDFAGISITKYSSYDSTTLASQTAASAGYFAIYIPGSGWKISTPGTSATAATVDTDGWSFTVTDPDGPTQAGHTVTWELDIDTGRLANIADTDKAVTVSANDASTANSNAGNTSAASTTQTTTASLKPYYRMDVVPYITGIKRNNSYNTYRTRSGGVALLRGETLNTITGFNLANLTNTTLSLSTDRAGTNVTTAAASFGTPTLSGSSLQFTVPDAARSGYLQLKVNSVAALNNVNGYKTYNTEDTTQLYDRTTLSDDRYVQIWRVNAADTFKSSSNAVYPAMAKATDGTLFASFSNYSSATVNYASFAKKTEVFYTYDPPEETDLCVTGSGTGGQVNVLYSANYQGGTASSWTSNSNDAGGLYCYDDSVDTIYVGRDYRKVLRFELFYHNQMLQQFKNFRVKRAGTASTDLIHVAYYDKITNSIHYSNTVENYSMDATTEFSWVNIDGGTDSDDSGTYSDGSSVSLKDARFTGTKRCTGTGDSVALALTSTKFPVIVYYDASNGVLKLACASATNPKGDVSKWTVQDVLGTSDPNYGTQVSYISAEIDSSGYLHIAFQNMKNQLVYIKSTNAPTNGTTAYTFGTSQTIDDSGTYIDLALNGTTPYISYLGRINSYDGMKIAYYDSSLDFNNDGTAEGGWETMTAPLNQKVTNVRSCIETQAKAADSNTYAAAIGFYPGADYRAAFFVGN
jgi:hypothetical protein